MHTFNAASIPLQPAPFLGDHAADVTLLRADLVHPVISGNKWFKLRYYISQAQARRQRRIITFGGAYSNHIVAAAAAANEAGLESIGIIRGEEPLQLSHTLQQARSYGMQLQFVSRSAYAAKEIPASLDTSDCCVIPEGGYGPEGAAGAGTLLPPAAGEYTHICCAVGTGTMMAGLMNACSPSQVVTGISLLKNNQELAGQVAALLHDPLQAVHLVHDYHFRGYARHTPELLQFMNDLFRQAQVPSDFVYTAKLFFGVRDLLRQQYFPVSSKLLVIHSGGLQGNASLPKGTLIF